MWVLWLILVPDFPSDTVSDEPEAFKNAPASLQLVGHTLEEEAVIGMAEIVDAALKEYKAKN